MNARAFSLSVALIGSAMLLLMSLTTRTWSAGRERAKEQHTDALALQILDGHHFIVPRYPRVYYLETFMHSPGCPCREERR